MFRRFQAQKNKFFKAKQNQPKNVEKQKKIIITFFATFHFALVPQKINPQKGKRFLNQRILNDKKTKLYITQATTQILGFCI